DDAFETGARVRLHLRNQCGKADDSVERGEQAYSIDAVQQLIAEQRDQGAAHHWADDSSDGHHRHIQRVRRRQQFERDDRRRKGSSCRLVETEEGLLHREHGQQQPDVVDAHHCDESEYGAGDDEPDGGGDKQLAPVDDIGQRAAPEAEDHKRNETEGSGESDVSRGPGDVEDLGRIATTVIWAPMTVTMLASQRRRKGAYFRGRTSAKSLIGHRLRRISCSSCSVTWAPASVPHWSRRRPWSQPP